MIAPGPIPIAYGNPLPFGQTQDPPKSYVFDSTPKFGFVLESYS